MGTVQFPNTPLTPVEALNRVMDDRVASTVITGARTLSVMASRDRIVETTKSTIDWDVELGSADTGVGLVTENTTDNNGTAAEPLQLRVGQYRIFHRINISRTQIQEAAAVAPADLANLLGTRIDRAINSIARRVNNLVHLGTGLPADAGVVGMGVALNDTVGYAGLTHADWKPIVNKNATDRAFTRDLMLTFDTQVEMAEYGYDTIVMHPNTVQKYRSIFDTLAGGASLPNVEEAMGLKKADLGHGGVSYNGFPIVSDPACPVGCIRLMNLSDISLYAYVFENTNGRIAINRSYGLPIHIAELPSSNSAMLLFELYTMPQLQVFNRKGVMQISNLLP